jgi:hypothetical protein
LALGLGSGTINRKSMKSFEAGFLEEQRISQNLLRTIRLLGEFKGKEEVYQQTVSASA